MGMDLILPGRQLLHTDQVSSIHGGDLLPQSSQLPAFVEQVVKITQAPILWRASGNRVTAAIHTLVIRGSERYPSGLSRVFYAGPDEPVPYAGSTPRRYPRSAEPTVWPLLFDPKNPDPSTIPTTSTIKPGDLLECYLGNLKRFFQEQGSDFDPQMLDELNMAQEICGYQRVTSIRQLGTRVAVYTSDVGPEGLNLKLELKPSRRPKKEDLIEERRKQVAAMYQVKLEQVPSPQRMRSYAFNDGDQIIFPCYDKPERDDPNLVAHGVRKQYLFAVPYIYVVDNTGAMIRFLKHPTGRGRWPAWVPQYDPDIRPVFEPAPPSLGCPHTPVITDIRFSAPVKKQLNRIMAPDVLKNLLNDAPASTYRVLRETNAGRDAFKFGYKKWLVENDITMSDEDLDTNVNRMIRYAYDDTYRQIKKRTQ